VVIGHLQDSERNTSRTICSLQTTHGTLDLLTAFRKKLFLKLPLLFLFFFLRSVSCGRSTCTYAGHFHTAQVSTDKVCSARNLTVLFDAYKNREMSPAENLGAVLA
jgi:hypothetical protein